MNVPACLKSVKPYIKRAEELDTDSSKEMHIIVAYFCRLYAMQLVLPLMDADKSGESRAFAIELMTRLENDKKGVAGGVNQEDGKEFVQNFALAVFKKADDEDRSGGATRSTARKFYCAANFMSTLNQFGPLEPKMEELLKYAAWKAADIEKCFKNGITPTPGPPGGFPLTENEKVEDDVSSNPFSSALPDVPKSLPKAPPAPSVTPGVNPPMTRTLSFKESDLEREARELAARLSDDTGDPKHAAGAFDPKEEIMMAKPVLPPFVPPTTSSTQPAKVISLNPEHVIPTASHVIVKPTIKLPTTALEDATEITRFALRALDSKHPNPDLAIQRLEEALAILRKR